MAIIVRDMKDPMIALHVEANRKYFPKETHLDFITVLRDGTPHGPTVTYKMPGETDAEPFVEIEGQHEQGLMQGEWRLYSMSKKTGRLLKSIYRYRDGQQDGLQEGYSHGELADLSYLRQGILDVTISSGLAATMIKLDTRRDELAMQAYGQNWGDIDTEKRNGLKEKAIKDYLSTNPQ